MSPFSGPTVGDIDTFWRDPQAPDASLMQDFLRVVMHRTVNKEKRLRS